MSRIFMFFFMLSGIVHVEAQKVIPLYAGQAPNSKNLPGLTDTTAVYGSGEEAFVFMLRVASPDLTVYLPEQKKNTGIAVIICPGGGYTGLATKHEGHDIAKRLQAEGIAGLVLKYRLPNADYVQNKSIVPWQDAQQAIQLTREQAKTWKINPQKIGILGSSAGGHLASTAGTHFQQAVIDNPKKISLRPDFMILNYPVISFADSLTHLGSRMNLIGTLSQAEINNINADWVNAESRFKSQPVSAKEVATFSNELQVTANTPPTFITHAIDDDVVPVHNSLVFIAALQKNRIPVESFFYARGGHGYGMNNPTSDVDWFEACLGWLKKNWAAPKI